MKKFIVIGGLTLAALGIISHRGSKIVAARSRGLAMRGPSWAVRAKQARNHSACINEGVGASGSELGDSADTIRPFAAVELETKPASLILMDWSAETKNATIGTRSVTYLCKSNSANSALHRLELFYRSYFGHFP
jgi:hypothetical protein